MEKLFDSIPVRVASRSAFEAAIGEVLSAAPECAGDAIRKLSRVAYDAMPSVDAAEFESVFSDTLGQIVDFARWCDANYLHCWPVCRFVAQKDVSHLASPYNPAYVTPLLVELIDAIEAIEGGARKLCYLYEDAHWHCYDSFSELLDFIDEHDFDCVLIYGGVQDASDVLQNILIDSGFDFSALPEIVKFGLDWECMLDFMISCDTWSVSKDGTYFEIAF